MTLAEDIAATEDRRGQRKEREKLDARLPVGVELTGDEGWITADLGDLPTEQTEAAWRVILEHNPYVSPETHEVDLTRNTAEITTWSSGESINHRCRVPVRLKAPGERLAAAKVAELTKLARKRKPITTRPADTGEWLVVCLADFQIGKADYGGTPATVERLNAVMAELRAKVRKMKPAGVCMVDLGDICEQVSCFYDSQTYTVDLNLTEQIDLAIELMLAFVESVADLVPSVVIGAVPSNHGEFRVAKGQVVTDRARDNIDLVLANSVKRIMSANADRYGHVSVWTPPTEGADPYVLTLDLDGVVVGFTHGHQVAARGPGRMGKLEQYWMNHQWSDRKRPRGESLPTVADADILVCGHGHTLLISEQTGKLLIQAPAAESGSEWYTTSTGGRSTAGVLVFAVSEAWPLLANRFEVL